MGTRMSPPSVASLTSFEVLLSLIVLPFAQVPHQPFAGMAARAAAKKEASAASVDSAPDGCVVVVFSRAASPERVSHWF
jgi:hypothetical protein